MIHLIKKYLVQIKHAGALFTVYMVLKWLLILSLAYFIPWRIIGYGFLLTKAIGAIILIGYGSAKLITTYSKK